MKRRISMLIASLLVLSYFTLKGPIQEYLEIKNGSDAVLAKKFVRAKYSELWEEQADNFNINVRGKDNHVYDELQFGQCKVINYLFYKDSQLIELEKNYSHQYPKKFVAFYFVENEYTYYYVKTKGADLESYSLTDPADKDFIEKTSSLSVAELKSDFEKSHQEFLKALHRVKNKELENVKTDLKLATLFMVIFATLSLVVTILFSRIKVD
ncbi:hypothetical protein M2139_002797 [Enterococcus sp. PF1-24]|uniref:hypothetical protein n=1 Tax=unclassified Enterococcus TaxID=2608891 RepID=UPI002476A491|nr:MULTISPECIES: hypothetical protein [unclassified Enterococcus]MDH6365769.1 hypothetical protein [Enterococcus sp. PFB1-1]MDH6402867.1 hypothetical protein [Enterococcus sp. PF1-24]